jgi:hypothetical protein
LTISPYGLGPCHHCRATVRWATTEAGKQQPLDPEPDPRGNVAARLGEGPGWWARVPTAERPKTDMERWFMPHAATCGRPPLPGVPPPRPGPPPARPAAVQEALPIDPPRRRLPPGVASLDHHRLNRKDRP